MPSPRTTPIARRPRPHPAKRARKVAGAVSVASMFVLTGCMAAVTRTATSTKSANAVTTFTTTQTGDDGQTTVSRTVTTAATAATPTTTGSTATQVALSNTSTHAS